jgi:hypothetical protein
VIDVVVVASVVRHIKRTELSVFDYWPNVSLPKRFAETIPVISLVSSNRL